MYKVYRDPEGANYLEQSHSNVSSTTKTTVKFSEDDYKKRIEDLNFEIKGLTKELEMVNFSVVLCMGEKTVPYCTPSCTLQSFWCAVHVLYFPNCVLLMFSL